MTAKFHRFINSAFYVAIALVVLLFLAATTHYLIDAATDDLTLNEHVYAEVSRVVATGGLPYLDAWDHKPPATYFYLAIFIKLFGPTIASINLAALVMALCWAVGLALLAYEVTRSPVGAATAFVLGGFYGTYSASHEINPDYLMVAFLIAAFYLAVKARGRWLWLGGAGLLLAVAFFAKQPAILHLPALLVLGYWAATKGHKWQTIGILAGFVLGLLLVALWAWTNGIGQEFWETAFATNFRYVLTSDNSWHFEEGLGQTVQQFIEKTLPLFLPLTLPAIIGLPSLLRDRQQSRLVWVLLGWLGLAFLGGALGRAMIFAYFAQILPPLILLNALVFSNFLEQKTLVCLMLVAAGVGVLSAFRTNIVLPDAAVQQEQQAEVAAIIDLVHEYVAEDECVWSWGDFAGHIYYFSERSSCTRFVNTMPMMVNEAFFTEENRLLYMQDLIASNPGLHARIDVWGYFPALQRYADRYRGPEILTIGDITYYAIDRSTWHEKPANFANEILLHGVDLYQPGEICNQETLQVAFTWEVLQPLNREYQLYVHLRSADQTELIAQLDTTPFPERPTTSWQQPGEIILSDVLSIQLPENLPAGDYTLVTGFYALDSQERLPVVNVAGQATQTEITLAQYTVAPNCAAVPWPNPEPVVS